MGGINVGGGGGSVAEAGGDVGGSAVGGATNARVGVGVALVSPAPETHCSE
jgi:hypothetical protein